MGESIKVIIFDYGDVIGKNPASYIFKAISKKFSIKIDKIKEEISRFAPKLQKNHIPENIFWKKLAKNLGIKSSSELKSIWMGEYEKHSKINKKIIFLIRRLKRMGYKVCLLSNTTKFHKRASFRKLLKREFSVIIYSCDVKMRKPEKSIYLLMLKKLKVKPEECLIVDNEKKNLYYPKKMGMKTIHYKSLQQLKSQLEKNLCTKLF
jgi:putative hydrolase of the HAD superfamily